MEDVEGDFELYEAVEANGERHSLLKAPKTLPSRLQPKDAEPMNDVINILMADVSGSMCSAWPHVVSGWQDYVKNKLTGCTKIFVFSSTVEFMRFGTDLTLEDNISGGTDLTSALRTVREEVEKCSEKYVRVFIVTDGCHNSSEHLPESEISLMSVPVGKTIDVFLLGVGYYFPVNYSIDIRSLLHNGSANLPSLFWAKEVDDIEEQILFIGTELSAGLVTLSLNHEGFVLPGAEKSEKIHFGEWLFFPEEPEKMPKLSVKVDDEEPQPLSMKTKQITMPLLMNQVFRQWNSVMIQQHRKKMKVSLDTFGLMDSLFKYVSDKAKSEINEENSVKTRLAKKHVKTCETDYATLVKESKMLIGIEGKYLTEIELAEGILKATVTTTKYDLKNLKMKGHGLNEFTEDVAKFKAVYCKHKEKILHLPPPKHEDCCSITMSSTLQDLQDPDFLTMLDENKFEFLKTFTMTGIPVYAPVRDASQINPWAMAIKHILVAPFTLLSQRAIEGYVEMGGDNLGIVDKDVVLQENEESTRFNVIIPTVPAAGAAVLKPLVRTNLYALCVTFCVLKNPHIIDHNAHIAALGCAWVRSVSDHPLKSRPEFVKERLANLVATARLYMDRESIVRYVKVLTSDPKQALMTESTEKYDDHTVKCEAMIKPMFFIHLERKQFNEEQAVFLLKMMLAEFLGRCLSNYKVDESGAKPFTDFFAVKFNDPETKKEWVETYKKRVVDDFKKMYENTLKAFFSLDDLRAVLKEKIKTELSTLADKLAEEITLEVDMKKVKSLKNRGSCGDVKWLNFKTWSEEIGLPEEKINAAFDKKQVFVYVTEALKCRQSRDRLAKEHSSYEDCKELVKKKVALENASALKTELVKEIVKSAEEDWLKLYQEAHQPLVMPMTPEEVVSQAQERNIQVTEETFPQIYRYDKKLKLLRNACQIPNCPHFLAPHRNFNQHIAVEREKPGFPHALHLVSYELSDGEVNAVVNEVATSSHAGRQNRPKPQPIKSTCLNYLCPEIEKLMDLYKRDQKA